MFRNLLDSGFHFGRAGFFFFFLGGKKKKRSGIGGRGHSGGKWGLKEENSDTVAMYSQYSSVQI